MDPKLKPGDETTVDFFCKPQGSVQFQLNRNERDCSAGEDERFVVQGRSSGPDFILDGPLELLESTKGEIGCCQFPKGHQANTFWPAFLVATLGVDLSFLKDPPWNR